MGIDDLRRLRLPLGTFEHEQPGDNLIYSAWERCKCGAGLVRARSGQNRADGAWVCSFVALHPNLTIDHQAHIERKSSRLNPIVGEDEPAARGATTRPAQGEEKTR